MRWLGSALLAGAFAVAGCGGEEESSGSAPVTPSQSLTCAEAGGTKRYPNASLENTQRLALSVAGDYAERIERPVEFVTKQLMSSTLILCDRAADPTHLPAAELRALAERSVGGEDPLITLLPDPTGAAATATTAPVTNGDALVAAFDEACKGAPAGTAKLIARGTRLTEAEGGELLTTMAHLTGGLGAYPYQTPDELDNVTVRHFDGAMHDIGSLPGRIELELSNRPVDKAIVREKIAEFEDALDRAGVIAHDVDGAGHASKKCLALLGA